MKQKEHIFINIKSVVQKKRVQKQLKRDKYITTTIALNFGLWSPWISSLFGQRDNGVWGFVFAFILALVLALKSFNIFFSASLWICWNFVRGRRNLTCHGHLRHFDRMFWGKRLRTWEHTNVWVIIYALRLPQDEVSRDSSGIKGLTPRDVTVVPRHSGKFLCEMALSFLHSQIIGSLLLGLSCLF